MPGFGEALKREREMRGVSLEEISESTKISTRLLRALELERFSDLPGGVFTRSFIRAYARYLGLDEEHVLAEYKQVVHPGSDYDLSRLAVSKPMPSKPSSRARILPWVAAAALLGGGYATYRYAHRPLESPSISVAAPAPESPAASTAGSAASTLTPSTSPQSPAADTQGGAQSTAQQSNPLGSDAAGGQAAPANPAAESSTTKPSGNAGAGLASAAGGNAQAASSGSPVLGEGDLVLKVAFRANDSFDVTTGNAQGTVLTLNGETQKPLGREGEFRKVHLTRSDLQNQNPAP